MYTKTCVTGNNFILHKALPTYNWCPQIGDTVYVAGQIALCPATMAMLESGPAAQSRLALRHVDRVLAAMMDGGSLCDVLLAICYVTRRCYIPFAQQEWRVTLNSAKKVCNNVWDIRNKIHNYTTSNVRLTSTF